MDVAELKRNFSCIRCGNSCKLYVKVTDEDIKRLKQAPHVKELGLKQDDFAEPDAFDPETGKHSLHMVNGACVFLSHNGEQYSCKVYEHRPHICRLYPFIGGKALPCSALKKFQKEA